MSLMVVGFCIVALGLMGMTVQEHLIAVAVFAAVALMGAGCVATGIWLNTHEMDTCISAGLEWRDGDCVRSEKEEPK